MQGTTTLTRAIARLTAIGLAVALATAVLPAAAQGGAQDGEAGELIAVGVGSSLTDAVVGAAATISGRTTTEVTGGDAFARGAALAESFAPGVDVAYIATAATYPDALTGGPLAIADDAPVLLVEPDAVPADTTTALQRLQPGRIVVLGGPAAVTDTVMDTLAELTEGTVTRLAGPNRWATAATIAQAGWPSGADTVYLATGENFPDAITGGLAAGLDGAPVLLVRATELSAETTAELDRLAPDELVILGGEAVVGPEVATALEAWGTVRRLAGHNRFATAAEVATDSWPDGAPQVWLVDGGDFADALLAAPVAGHAAGGARTRAFAGTSTGQGGPILLAEQDRLPDETADAFPLLHPDGPVDPVEEPTDDPGTGGGGGPRPNTGPPTLAFAATITPRLDLPADGPGLAAAEIGDPTDPLATDGATMTVTDPDGPSTVTVTATSDDQQVVPDAGLAVSGSGATRVLTVQPAAAGTATITITASDGAATDTLLLHVAVGPAFAATSRFHTGTQDGSAAIDAGDGHFVSADDELQVLRLYDADASGLPVAAFDMGQALVDAGFLGEADDELDLEAAARLGDVAYWFGSHGNGTDGDDEPDRESFFTTTISGSGAATTLAFGAGYGHLLDDMIAWDDTDGHGLGASALGLAAGAADGISPNDPAGLTIEGFAFAPDGTTGYVAFRTPLQGPTQQALVVPVTNLAALPGTATAGAATFDDPILLDLGGRGIRDIARNDADEYLILAGPAGDEGPISLFTWDGDPLSAPVERAAELDVSFGSIEGLPFVPNPLTDTSQVRVLADNGDEDYFGSGQAGKDVDELRWRRFRSDLVILGAAAAPAELAITEIYEGLSGEDGTVDWFEVTNLGEATASTAGLAYDDDSAELGDAVPLPPTLLAAGESAIVLIGTDPVDDTAFADSTAEFEAIWGTGPRILALSDGAGLGSGGDTVNLLAPDGTVVASGTYDGTAEDDLATTTVEDGTGRPTTTDDDGAYTSAAFLNDNLGLPDDNARLVGSPVDPRAPQVVASSPFDGQVGIDEAAVLGASVQLDEPVVADLDALEATVTVTRTDAGGSPAVTDAQADPDLGLVRLAIDGLEADADYLLAYPAGFVSDLAGNPAPAHAVAFSTSDGPQLQVTEIYHGNEPDNLTEDWFEVTNLGSAPADTTGLYVDDDSADPTEDLPLPAMVLAPGASLVVLLDDAPEAVTEFEQLWGVGATVVGIDGPGLGAGGDSVVIFDGNTTDAAVVDRADFPGAVTDEETHATWQVPPSGPPTRSVLGVDGAYRSVEVAGVALVGSPADTRGPVVTGLDPADGATGVPVGTTLRLTLDEPVLLGTGDVVLTDEADATLATIPAGDLDVDGRTVTITPPAALPADETITVTVDATVVTDLAGNPFVGIAEGEWAFTTVSPDGTPPTVDALTPADDATDVPVGNDLVIDLSEDVQAGDGEVRILDGATTLHTIAAADLAITGDIVTIDAPADLPGMTEITVEVDAGAVLDLSGEAFAGLAGTAWTFTTGAGPEWRITEVYTGSSGGENATADWFEVTNVGTAVGSTAGLGYDDESADPADFSPLDPVTLEPGQSAVFLLTDAADRTADVAEFAALWGTEVTVGIADGGAGLGNGGDAVTLFDAAMTVVDSLAYTTGSDLATLEDPDGDGTVRESVEGENGAYTSTPYDYDGAGDMRSMVGSPGVPATLRVATYNVSLNRANAGDLITDLSDGTDAQAQGIAEVIQRTRPDVVLLNEFDFDAAGDAVRLFADNHLAVSQGGADPITYPHVFLAPSNTGVPSGHDLNNDGTVGGPDDAFGFGTFEGQYGMALLSRYPIDTAGVRTFQELRWADMPGALLPDDPDTAAPDDWFTPEELADVRLSSKSHWDVPVVVGGQVIHVLAAHPTPPVFDGPEDRNGRRNHDEIRFWADYVDPTASAWITDDDGGTGGLADGADFVIVGDYNADPHDGDSVASAANQILQSPFANPDIETTMAPSSAGGTRASADQAGANTGHTGDPAFDTGDFGFAGAGNPDAAPGNLRVDHVIPSLGLPILGSGVFWLTPEDPLWPLGEFPHSDHRLVHVDLDLAAD